VLTEPERFALRDLEESLWRAETRFDRAHMERVLAPDFVEFGRSGRTYSRADTLASPAVPIGGALPLEEFAVRELDRDTVLVTYVSRVGDAHPDLANRASIWSRSAGGWRLRFHQGTPRADR